MKISEDIYFIFVCLYDRLTPQQHLRSYRGGDHDDDDEIRIILRNPTAGTQCPTLHKWQEIFYTSSRTDTAGHTKPLITLQSWTTGWKSRRSVSEARGRKP